MGGATVGSRCGEGKVKERIRPASGYLGYVYVVEGCGLGVVFGWRAGHTRGLALALL